jgi:hypothetical protein
VVSPRVGPLDEAEVIREFLKAVSAPGPGGRLMAQQLGQAGTLSVARCEPFRSPIGKMVPFYVAPKE